MAAVSAEARLAELGLELPDVAAPVAAYVPAVVTGDLLFTSTAPEFRTDLLLSRDITSRTSSNWSPRACVSSCYYRERRLVQFR